MNKKLLLNSILIVAVLAVAGYIFLSGDGGLAPVTLSPSPSVSVSPAPTLTPTPPPAEEPGLDISPIPSISPVSPSPALTPSPTPTPLVTLNTITYTSAGYSPGTITVQTGTAVTFKNNSSVQIWPASNPHPSHTNYPGFDAGDSIPPGGQWSFKFTEVGTWGYHDHLRPNLGGIIVVQ